MTEWRILILRITYCIRLRGFTCKFFSQISSEKKSVYYYVETYSILFFNLTNLAKKQLYEFLSMKQLFSALDQEAPDILWKFTNYSVIK